MKLKVVLASLFIGSAFTIAAVSEPIDVIVAKSQMINVPEVLNAVGHMKAIQSVDLSFDVDGHIAKIDAENGHLVHKGQVIAELDNRSDLAQLTSLQAAAALAESTYQRTLKLKQYGGISAQQVEQNKAQMVAAQAAAEEQKLVVSEEKMVAPFDGVLGSFQYSVGAHLPKGTTLVQLIQEAPLLVEYSVPASQRSALEIGQTVQVTTGAYPNRVFSGILNYISPDVAQTTGTLTLQAKVDNADYLLLPGMFVDIKQTLNPNRSLLMVPDIALMTDIQGEYVYKVVGETVQKTYVEVGEIWKNLAEIKSGLSTGDTLVVAGQQKLTNDSVIHIIDTQNIQAA